MRDNEEIGAMTYHIHFSTMNALFAFSLIIDQMHARSMPTFSDPRIKGLLISRFLVSALTGYKILHDYAIAYHDSSSKIETVTATYNALLSTSLLGISATFLLNARHQETSRHHLLAWLEPVLFEFALPALASAVLNQSASGSTDPDFLAICRILSSNVIQCCRILFQFNVLPFFDTPPSSPWHQAAIAGDQSTLITMLKDPSLPINARDSHGQTSLHLALQHPEYIRHLLADDRLQVNARNKQGRTAFLMAWESLYQETAALLGRDLRVDVNASVPVTDADNITANKSALHYLQDAWKKNPSMLSSEAAQILLQRWELVIQDNDTTLEKNFLDSIKHLQNRPLTTMLQRATPETKCCLLLESVTHPDAKPYVMKCVQALKTFKKAKAPSF
jgi:ankyrin repeat protein